MNQEQKLERWAEREIQRNLDKMILSDEQGGYVAFGKYLIEPQDTGYSVSTWDRTVHCFANKRTALSYCIADKINHINLANQILNLDRKQQILANDIAGRSAMGNRGRTQDFYETVNTKIQPKIARHDMVKAELEKCINSAKYIQIKGFNNETSRIHG
mgnify:CR=1 FL=1